MTGSFKLNIEAFKREPFKIKILKKTVFSFNPPSYTIATKKVEAGNLADSIRTVSVNLAHPDSPEDIFKKRAGEFRLRAKAQTPPYPHVTSDQSVAFLKPIQFKGAWGTDRVLSFKNQRNTTIEWKASPAANIPNFEMDLYQAGKKIKNIAYIRLKPTGFGIIPHILFRKYKRYKWYVNTPPGKNYSIAIVFNGKVYAKSAGFEVKD